MANLTVQTIDSNFVVDSRLIAAELGITHKSFQETIRTYKVDFEEFGNLAVHSEGVKGTSSYSEFLYLTEDQSYLSLTYSNNTPEVRRAKKNLVHAFKAAREASVVKAPSNMIEAMEVALAALKEAETTKLLLAAADEKVKEMQPKAEVYDVVIASDKLLSFSDAAKIINSPGLGRNNLMQLLRDKKILQYSNLPYQKYVSQGQFEVVEVDTYAGLKTTCKVTQKGLGFLIRLLKDNNYTVPSKAEAA